MEINVTKQQYRNLVILAMLGSYVRSAVAEDRNEPNFEQYDKLVSYLLESAEGFGCTELKEKFHGKIIPSDKLSEIVDEVIDEYNESEFWHLLEIRLGQRDFFASLNKAERQKISKDNGWLPPEIQHHYECYADEFDRHGLSRLVIDKAKKAIQGGHLHHDNDCPECQKLKD